MKKTISQNIKQALSNRGFLAGMMGVVLAILLSSFQDMLTAFRSKELLAYGFHNTLISNALVSDAMTLALPILCTLPYTASFIDDIKSGFIKVCLPRTTISGYIWGKSFACAVSGGLVLAFGILISNTICALVFLPMEAALAKGAEAPHYLKQLVETLLMYFASGAFWSMVGLTFATLTNSKYMAYASPFVLFYVLIILYERYFDKLYVLYPREWLNPSDKWMYGRLGVTLLLLELSVVLGLAFAASAKRRIAQI